MAVVITRVNRTEPSLVERSRQFEIATVHEAQSRTGVMASCMRPNFRPAHNAGTAIKCEVTPGGKWMIDVAIEQCQAGDILVVVPRSPCVDGYFGDLRDESLKARGVRGLDRNPHPRNLNSRSLEHWVRRAEEMRKAALTVVEAGIGPIMSGACARRQDWTAGLAPAREHDALATMLDSMVHLNQVRNNDGRSAPSSATSALTQPTLPVTTICLPGAMNRRTFQRSTSR
jgi:hypothetical protein